MARYSLKTVRVTLTVDEPPPKKLTQSADAVAVLRPIFAGLDADQEHIVLLTLNNAMRVTGFKVIASGSMTASLIDPKIIFRTALLLGATRIMIAHNHPSSDTMPSSADASITRRIAEVGKALDMPLEDHIILGDNTGRWHSAREEGELTV